MEPITIKKTVPIFEFMDNKWGIINILNNNFCRKHMYCTQNEPKMQNNYG